MEPLQGSVISPALYNHFVSACLVTDVYMTSYAGDFALLALLCFQHRGRWSNGELCTTLVRWADGKQLVFAPQKYSVHLGYPVVLASPTVNYCE